MIFFNKFDICVEIIECSLLWSIQVVLSLRGTQSQSTLLFLLKYLFASFMPLSTMCSICTALCRRPRFPMRTFPLILLCQERKEERALLKHMATYKQHHYVFDKNPHSNILCAFSMGKKMHSISITQLTMPRSFSMCGTTEEVYYYTVR